MTADIDKKIKCHECDGTGEVPGCYFRLCDGQGMWRFFDKQRMEYFMVCPDHWDTLKLWGRIKR